MQIQQITVTAGRTFNHPHEQYSNLRPEVVLVAALEPGEDARACVQALQRQAEGMVEDHKRNMLKSLEDLHQLTERQAEMRGLHQQLTSAQSRLDEIRAEHPELKLTEGSQAS